MKKEVKDFINNSYQTFRDKEESDMVISQVLSLKNEDGTIGFQAIAVSQNDPDEIRCIRENIQGKSEYMKILEWDYNIEDYLLDDLENIWKDSRNICLTANNMKSLHKSFHYIVQIT